MRRNSAHSLLSLIYIIWVLFTVLAIVIAVPQASVARHVPETPQAQENIMDERHSNAQLDHPVKYNMPRPFLPRWTALPDTLVDTKEPEDNLDSTDGRKDYDNEGDEEAVSINRLPYAHGFRRVLGDLETCTDDLFPSMERGAGWGFQIKGPRLRACRQAFFMLLRWAKGQRKQWSDTTISVPESEEVVKTKRDWGEDTEQERAVPNDDGCLQRHRTPDTYGPNDGLRARSAANKSGRLSKCQESACDIPDLATLCTNKKGMLKPGVGHTCKMCFPQRNDDLILQHCRDREKRERQVFYILCAMLITVGVAAGVLTYFHNARQKLRNQCDCMPTNERGLPASMVFNVVKVPTLGVKLKRPLHESWGSIIAACLRRKKSLSFDVEKQPSPTTRSSQKSLGTQVLLPTPTRNITSPALSRQFPTAASNERVNDTKPPGARTTSLQADMIPAVPRARSFSFQIPLPSSAIGSSSTDIDGIRHEANLARRGGHSRRAGTG